MEKKKDLRVVKTKNLLYQTLIDLMKDKTFEEIKVSDICSKAMINRSTFYAHYEDKYELLVDFISNLKEEFINESKIAAQVILKNIAIAEEIPVKEKDGRYTVHITLKVRETDVLDAIRKHVMANERLQKVFKKEKFDELWNE